MKKTPVIEFNNLLSKASQSYWNVRSVITEIIWKQNKKNKPTQYTPTSIYIDIYPKYSFLA